MRMRPAAVAGTWYPGSAGALTRELDIYLDATGRGPIAGVGALIVPHAGLMFSGPVGAHAYRAASGGSYDAVLLVGPSHFTAFDGVSVWPEGAFESPLGPAPIDAAIAAELLRSPLVQDLPAAHRREHSLEMQLPFLRLVLPDVPIVPMLIGYQTRETIEGLARVLAEACAGRRVLLIASTDLSHYFEAKTAADLDGRVQALVAGFDADGFLDLFERYPEAERGRYVACGGGAAIAVMMAAKRRGDSGARVLKYAHSGEVSGDYDGVVGYLAAALGSFENGHD